MHALYSRTTEQLYLNDSWSKVLVYSVERHQLCYNLSNAYYIVEQQQLCYNDSTIYIKCMLYSRVTKKVCYDWNTLSNAWWNDKGMMYTILCRSTISLGPHDKMWNLKHCQAACPLSNSLRQATCQATCRLSNYLCQATCRLPPSSYMSTVELSPSSYTSTVELPPSSYVSTVELPPSSYMSTVELPPLRNMSSV